MPHSDPLVTTTVGATSAPVQLNCEPVLRVPRILATPVYALLPVDTRERRYRGW
jgi:hypothetical protein